MLSSKSGRAVLNRGEITDAETSKPALTLSLQQARNLHLAAQGLLQRRRGRAKKVHVLDAIVRMRLLQIDTIHVVARSPYLVLFSRLGAYPQRWLGDLLEGGALFECWAHEACFAPAGDYAMHRHGTGQRQMHWAQKHAQRMYRDHRDEMDRMLAHIRAQGPVKAADFERKVKGGAGGWWGWKDEKRWLEAWFALGELMILRRESFQRVYDLRERVEAGMTAGCAESAMNDEQRRHRHVLDAVAALGIAKARWIADYFRSGKKHKDSDLQQYIDSGELVRVAVRGWDEPGYVHRDALPLVARAARGALRANLTTVLSPFDPVIWHRERASALFGFDYTLECYTPGPKRRFGYFVLPILHRGQLIGRLDAKAHRGEGCFEIKKIFLEAGTLLDEDAIHEIAAAIREAADWHETPEVLVRRSDPPVFAKTLRAALARLASKDES